MNENKVPGIWKWTVILLVACNVALVATLWLKPQRRPDRDEHRPSRARDYVIEQLRFTDEQVHRYDELILEHRHKMDSLRMASMELRKLLFNNIKNAPGGINADSVAQLIAGNQHEIEIITYRHFAQVRAEICTEAQKPELDKIIEQVMKFMNGAMRGGPPPRERDEQERPRRHEGAEHGPRDEHEPPPDNH